MRHPHTDTEDTPQHPVRSTHPQPSTPKKHPDNRSEDTHTGVDAPPVCRTIHKRLSEASDYIQSTMTNTTHTDDVVDPELYKHTVHDHLLVTELYHELDEAFGPPADVLRRAQEIFGVGYPSGQPLRSYVVASLSVAGDELGYPFRKTELEEWLQRGEKNTKIHTAKLKLKAAMIDEEEDFGHPQIEPQDWIDRYEAENDVPDAVIEWVEQTLDKALNGPLAGSNPSAGSVAAALFDMAATPGKQQVHPEFNPTQEELSVYFDVATVTLRDWKNKIEDGLDDN